MPNFLCNNYQKLTEGLKNIFNNIFLKLMMLDSPYFLDAYYDLGASILVIYNYYIIINVIPNISIGSLRHSGICGARSCELWLYIVWNRYVECWRYMLCAVSFIHLMYNMYYKAKKFIQAFDV